MMTIPSIDWSTIGVLSGIAISFFGAYQTVRVRKENKISTPSLYAVLDINDDLEVSLIFGNNGSGIAYNVSLDINPYLSMPVTHHLSKQKIMNDTIDAIMPGSRFVIFLGSSYIMKKNTDGLFDFSFEYDDPWKSRVRKIEKLRLDFHRVLDMHKWGLTVNSKQMTHDENVDHMVGSKSSIPRELLNELNPDKRFNRP